MALHVVIDHTGWKNIRGLKSLAVTAVESTLPAAARNKEITLLFSTDDVLKTLNKDWRGKNKPTNVLSFPAAYDLKVPRGEKKPLGDIALAYETVASEALEAGKTLKAHTTHLIVHGVLHLLGYDHLNEADAEKMEAKEIRILKKLGIADPYEN